MKRGLDWYKREPASMLDAIRAARMTDTQAAVYNVVLDLIYLTAGETPNDPRFIAAHFSNMGAAKARRTIDELIEMGKLDVVGDMLSSAAWSEQSETRSPMRRDVRSEVFDRDGALCSYCGSSTGPFEIDHVHPWSRGGSHAVENLVVACRPCNRSKGAKTPGEWLG